MGFAPGGVIGRAGNHLLGLLKTGSSVRYSRFYDGSDETHDGLLAAFGLDSDRYSPELLMDVAVSQLEKKGIVRMTYLDEQLADEERDYLIELTPMGRQFVEGSVKFNFWDVDL